MKDKQWESNRPPNWIYGCVDYEEGADEMLKALKSEKGFLDILPDCVRFHIPDTAYQMGAGRWVFIPDTKEQNNPVGFVDK